jgi:hypothetical protein
MKLKHFLILSAALIFIFSFKAACSQEAPRERQNQVSFNLVPLVFNSYNLFYERALQHPITIRIGLNYFQNEEVFFIRKTNSRWFSFTTDFNYYLGKPFNSLYIGPYIKSRFMNDINVVNYQQDAMGMYSIASPPQDELWAQLGLGVVAGYNFTTRPGFSIGVFLGGGYFPLTYLHTVNTGIATQNFSNAELRLGLTAGWAF